jgi:3',5'-cyclic AMP phosphodiesterase CpdA
MSEEMHREPEDAAAIRIFLVSDTHLSRRRAYFQDNWEVFVAEVAAERPELVIGLGDLSFNGADEDDDLAFARSEFDRLAAPTAVIPGNHDLGESGPDPRRGQTIDAVRHERYLRHFQCDRWIVDRGVWRIIGLNSQLMESGLAEEREQRAWLVDAVETAERRHLLLCLHKPLFLHAAEEPAAPLKALGPEARQWLLSLCERARVPLVVTGHAHEHRVLRHVGTELLWVPTTSFVQPGNASFGGAGLTRAGYVALDLLPDGSFVHRFVEPPLFVNLDLGNWMRHAGTSIRLPPRPLRQRALP